MELRLLVHLAFSPCWPSPEGGYSYNSWGWAHLTECRNPCLPIPLFLSLVPACLQCVYVCVNIGVIHSHLPNPRASPAPFQSSQQHFNIPWSKPILYQPPSPTTMLSLSSPQGQMFQQVVLPSAPTSLSKVTSRQLVSVSTDCLRPSLLDLLAAANVVRMLSNKSHAASQQESQASYSLEQGL